jgi:pyruvate/2-oxoglutarate dehydrogenase complex dihydrolipoamide acyltransferase (E2) component
VSTIEVQVPDIGDFEDVPVTEILVAVGDEVQKEDPLVALESEKATMEVPSPEAGTVKELKVSEGDTVSEGSVILVLETADAAGGSSDGDGSADGAESQPGGQVDEKDEDGAEHASNPRGEDGPRKDEPPKGGGGSAGRASSGGTTDAKSGAPGTDGDSYAGGSDATRDAAAAGDRAPAKAEPSKASDEVKAKGDLHVDVVVLGSGPGG